MAETGVVAGFSDSPDLSEVIAALARREKEISAAEVDLAIAEGQARAREAEVQTRHHVLGERAQGLDAWARQAHETALVGAQADLNSDVHASKAARLHLARQRLAQAREEWIVRRRQLLDERLAELEAIEQGLARAQQRVDARERRLLEAMAHPPVHPEPAHVAAPGASSAPAKDARSSAKSSTHLGTGVGIAKGARMVGHISTQPLGTGSAHSEGRTSRSLGSPSMKPVDITPLEVRPGPSLPEDPRHAQTLSMLPDETDAPVVQVDVRQTGAPTKERARATQATAKLPPPHEVAVPVGVPDDLPDAVPDRLARRPPNAPFLPRLTLGGEALVRAQLQVDRANEVVLVSFRRGAPHLEQTPVLEFQSPSGRFSAELRRIVPAPEGGAVVVLSIAAWDAARCEAFDRALNALS